MEKTKYTPVVASATGQVYKIPNRLGRGVPEVKDVFKKKCSCSRDKTIVFCRSCGYYCNGRIRLQCDVHPHVSEICIALDKSEFVCVIRNNPLRFPLLKYHP